MCDVRVTLAASVAPTRLKECGRPSKLGGVAGPCHSGRVRNPQAVRDILHLLHNVDRDGRPELGTWALWAPFNLRNDLGTSEEYIPEIAVWISHEYIQQEG